MHSPRERKFDIDDCSRDTERYMHSILYKHTMELTSNKGSESRKHGISVVNHIDPHTSLDTNRQIQNIRTDSDGNNLACVSVSKLMQDLRRHLRHPWRAKLRKHVVLIPL